MRFRYDPAFGGGAVIGVLGGLFGLGGAETRPFHPERHKKDAKRCPVAVYRAELARAVWCVQHEPSRRLLGQRRAESFFRTLKVIDMRRWPTKHETKRAGDSRG